MSEHIYLQVEDAIRRKLYCFRDMRPGWNTPAWVRPIRIELGNIIMLWGDCGIESRPEDLSIWTIEDWSRVISSDGTGLFRKTGMWNFTPDTDPAADCVRYCHQNPDSAGRELHRLREEVARLSA